MITTLTPPSEQRRMGRTEALLHELRRMPFFRQLVPSDAALGWPLPLRRNGHVYAQILGFGIPRNAEGRIELFPPTAIIVIDWQSHSLVKYLDLRFERPSGFPDANCAVGSFPHAAIKTWSVPQYREARIEQLGLFDEMFDALRTRTTMPIERMNRFKDLFQNLAEPGLEPYYRGIAPGFCTEFLGPPKS